MPQEDVRLVVSATDDATPVIEKIQGEAEGLDALAARPETQAVIW
jgi:hypothetical protein